MQALAKCPRLRTVLQWHDATLVPLFGIRTPNIDGKPVLNLDGLLVLPDITQKRRDTVQSRQPKLRV